jgi:hypothetical protein
MLSAMYCLAGWFDIRVVPCWCPCSIWWQFIPYFLVGVSEVFTNIGTMELFYTQGGPTAVLALALRYAYG